MSRELRDNPIELYMQGGLELAVQATYGLKRDLIIELETSALTHKKGEIIQFYAVNRCDEDDEFDVVKPTRLLTLEAEGILGCDQWTA